MSLPVKHLPLKVDKEWGYELHIHNDNEYCGKILHFDKGKNFSMHYHLLKRETWYILKGTFKLFLIDTEKGLNHTQYFSQGECLIINRGQPHQLYAIEDSDIMEVSTQHFDLDSYRVWRHIP